MNSNFNFFNGCSSYFDPCVGGTAAVDFLKNVVDRLYSLMFFLF